MKRWTLTNIPDLTGKVIIVTGGNSGLGFESAKAFASKGAEIILTSRTIQKGEEAKAMILESVPKAKIPLMPLDLANLESIRDFANQFKSKYGRLDVLLNNAGIMMSPYHHTKDGFEGQMGVNHLGHFALTGLIIDLLKNTPGSRVVNVSSNAHKYGNIDFDNLLYENGKDYTPMKAYSRSKLSNLLFTYDLQRRIEKLKLNIIAVAAHPGASHSNLARYIEGHWWYKLFFPLMKLFIQSQAAGALPQIRAAVDPFVKGAEYYGPDGWREVRGNPVPVQSNQASHNLEDAKRLWEESEKLTGVDFLN